MQYLYSIPSLLAYTFVIGKSVIMVGQEPHVIMGDCNHEEALEQGSIFAITT